MVVYIQAVGSDAVLEYVYGCMYATNNTRLFTICGTSVARGAPKYGLPFVVPSLRFATCPQYVPKYVLPSPAFSLLTQTDKRYFFVLSIEKPAPFHHPSSLLAASFPNVAQTTHEVFRGVLYAIIWFSQAAPF